MSVTNRLGSEIQSIEEKIDRLQTSIDEKALDAELDPKVAAKRDAEQEQLFKLQRVWTNKKKARQQAFEREEETRKAASRKQWQTQVKATQKKAEKARDAGIRLADTLGEAAIAYREFHGHRLELISMFREVGFDGFARSIGRDIRDSTLKHVLVTKAPELARALGVPAHLNGGRRGSLGLIDAIERADPGSWLELMPDDPSFVFNATGDRK